MFELAWQEINRNGQIVMKRKKFKTRSAMENFIERLFDKISFWQIYGMREV